MPPFVPRKRLRDDSPAAGEAPEPGAKGQLRRSTRSKKLTAPPRNATLFDDLDAALTPRHPTRNGESTTRLDESEDEESSLTSLSDADFEDVPVAKRQKVEETASQGDDDDEDEDIEFEDVETPQVATAPDVPVSEENLELTLVRDTRISLAAALGKKGPTKTERKMRTAAHCIHVQLLLWHNAIRNAWCCDPTVQGIMLSHLPPRLWAEVEKWRKKSGLEAEEETPSKRTRSKTDLKGTGRASARQPREWSSASRRLEQGTVDISHGDPLFRLMKYLAAWWKQRFRVTAPGLRKWGYMPLQRLDLLIKDFKQGPHNPEKFGERIRNLEEFRQCAQECAGSRDVGAQLFTALLRALGLEARLVASLQPLGFGWTKLEEADPERDPVPIRATSQNDSVETEFEEAVAKGKKPVKGRPARRSSRLARLEETSDSELHLEDSDDELAVDLPPPPERQGKVYDADLEYPHYWTEVLSPVTKKYLPVDPIVKGVVATNRELVEGFEPRGSRADKAKQVIAYVVGYSQDGTAKDVTVRYLKRQILPGRTKGMRLPIEKVPVYNRYGKIKRYDQVDWFKKVMRGYSRGSERYPITEVDQEEDATDLKPANPEKKEVKEGEETLQYYKQSKEYVLERHLKREEALLPTAKPVKMFRTSKSKNSGPVQEEPVYLRKDVVQVKSMETWHKQGRAPKPGVTPLKWVPYRAATTNRRREIAEAEAATGEKVLQPLYSYDQTDWIIPPPIKDGKIPKNEYGNIDLFVEHMCPKGAVHVPYRGALRVAKRLGIDYAEAVVDFEFGHRMAVPVIQGVVIAEEHYERVMEELARDEAERKRKEDEKRRKAALSMWRRFIMGMRIVQRIRQEYGDVGEDVDVFGRDDTKSRGLGQAAEHNAGTAEDEEMAGGFLPEGCEEEEDDDGGHRAYQRSGFFPVGGDEDDDDDGGDALEVDHGEGMQAVAPAVASEPSPEPEPEPEPEKAPKRSVVSTRPTRKKVAKRRANTTRRRRRRKNASPSSEEEVEDTYDEDSPLSGSDEE